METSARIKHKLSDTIVLTGRSMRHSLNLDTLLTATATPIMMLLMFVYVFGGAMDTGATKNITYMVPGIILMTITTGSVYTAIRVNNDITSGIIDRFHSMPIARSSILTGHVMTSVVFNAFSSLLVLIVALLMGFSSDAGFIAWILVIGTLLLFTLAMTWISAFFGILANSVEGASAFSYPLLFLLFVSSAFVPTESMPGIVRSFATHQPMTPLIETVRSLLMTESVGNSALIATSWWMGILLISSIAAIQIYKRKTG
ncbi:ABC transporter permease [Virgibacillus flavescens]|uniref:ABC transporter permease n=1 Tax=Virgibacillus flavescens TaxID=1611422 RepID=UPI003D353D29